MEKVRRHFVYHGVVNGLETNVYYVINKKTHKKQYFVLHEFPNTSKNKTNAQKAIDKYNEGHHRKAEMLFRRDKDEVEHSYINEPCMAFEAIMAIVETEKAIKKEKKELGIEEPKALVSEEKKYNPPSQNLKRAIAFTLFGLTMTGFALGISMGFISPDSTRTETPTVYVGETNVPTTSDSTETTKTPSTSGSFETTQEQEQERVYIDYDSLKYKTHTNSNGATLIELADALKIANACYNNLIIEIERYNEKSTNDFSFDVDKFKGSMFTAEQIRESSLFLYVDEGENIKNAVDYGDRCRGPFKIGPAAIEEANEVSMKLTGEKVIRDERDLYDVVRACRACMYIAIKNYEYCAGVIGDAVEPNMVFDAYLYGCGNVRSWLRDCLEDGEYNGEYGPKTYSKDIMYYYSVVEPYWQKLLAGKTDGSHDKEWQNTYYNGLWQKPDWSKEVESSQASEPGQ